MLTALVAPVLGIVVSTATGSIVGQAARLIIPPTTKAFASFGIQLGVAIAGGLAGSKVANIVMDHTNSIIETVKNTGAEEETAQEEDN